MNRNIIFNKKILLITGGTGSFGNAMVRKIINSEIEEVRILSRDEQKQDEMRKLYKNNKLKFHLGDVRDIKSCENAVKGVHFIFHAAALKQVPSCEFFPLEAIKTNVIGTENILEASIKFKVEKVICLSTDKAVYPINVMGMTKSLMEKVMIAKSRLTKDTIMCATRYGNVIASRGSVIPLFVDQIRKDLPVTITNPKMTRFIMSLDEAIDLVLFAFLNGKSGDIYVKKSPSASIEMIVKVLKNIMNKSNLKETIIGTRHGEKHYEILMSKEEIQKSKESDNYFKIPTDKRTLDYDLYFEKGQVVKEYLNEYNSNNAYNLNFLELKAFLLNNKDLNELLKNDLEN